MESIGPPEALITGRSIDSGQPLGNAIRERDMVNRETIDVEPFVVEPLEYEHEYRCTEYEYDLPD